MYVLHTKHGTTPYKDTPETRTPFLSPRTVLAWNSIGKQCYIIIITNTFFCPIGVGTRLYDIPWRGVLRSCSVDRWTDSTPQWNPSPPWRGHRSSSWQPLPVHHHLPTDTQSHDKNENFFIEKLLFSDSLRFVSLSHETKQGSGDCHVTRLPERGGAGLVVSEERGGSPVRILSCYTMFCSIQCQKCVPQKQWCSCSPESSVPLQLLKKSVVLASCGVVAKPTRELWSSHTSSH